MASTKIILDYCKTDLKRINISFVHRHLKGCLTIYLGNSHFYPPPREVGAGDIVIAMSGRAAVRPCVRVSFPDDISETGSRIDFILHTHIP